MQAFLSLGSNRGDTTANLSAAVDSLDRLDGVSIASLSHCYESEAWGEPGQSTFLNLAVEIETALEPLELLNAAKGIERALGREPAPRWGPRIIDIDIVLWGDRVLDSPELTLPHREFRNRAFVLAPLAEIAADVVDPVTGSTVEELANRPEATGRVERAHKLDH